MLSKRLRREDGFTLVTVMGAMVVLALITVSAFAAVNGDAQQSGRDVSRKQALAAAEAGVNQYLFGLNGDNNYWDSGGSSDGGGHHGHGCGGGSSCGGGGCGGGGD